MFYINNLYCPAGALWDATFEALSLFTVYTGMITLSIKLFSTSKIHFWSCRLVIYSWTSWDAQHKIFWYNLTKKLRYCYCWPYTNRISLYYENVRSEVKSHLELPKLTLMKHKIYHVAHIIQRQMMYGIGCTVIGGIITIYEYGHIMITTDMTCCHRRLPCRMNIRD